MQAKINQQLYFGVLPNQHHQFAIKSPIIDIDSVLISDDSTSDLSSKFAQIDQITKIAAEGQESEVFSSCCYHPSRKSKLQLLREKKHFKQQQGKSIKKTTKQPTVDVNMNGQCEISNASELSLLKILTTSQTHTSFSSQVENKQPGENNTFKRVIFEKIRSQLNLRGEKKKQSKSADQLINIKSFQNDHNFTEEAEQFDFGTAEAPFVINNTKKIDKSHDNNSSGDGVVTRRQAEALGLNFIDQVGFVDKEEEDKVMSRRSALAIPKVKAIIDKLSEEIKTKFYRKPIAKVLQVPIASINTVRHKIYAQCLKMQLQKRRFIYLD